MEPAVVQPIYDVDEDYVDMDPLDVPDEDDQEEYRINEETTKELSNCKQLIHSFKKKLFQDIVSSDKNHDSSDIGGLITFHALFLQCVGYWIGLLDGQPVPLPKFSKKQHTAMFLDIAETIKRISTMNVNARILLYSMLFVISIQHPYDLSEHSEDNHN